MISFQIRLLVLVTIFEEDSLSETQFICSERPKMMMEQPQTEMLIKAILRSSRCVLLLAAFLAQYSGPSKATPYPAEYWARRPTISHVSLSPDGASLALLRITEKGANPIIEVYPTDDLKAEPLG